MIELYDSEIAQVGPIWQRLMNEFSTKPATEANYDELKKRAFDEFIKIGLVVRIDIPAYIPEGIEAAPMYTQPVIEIQGRVPGSDLSNIEQDEQTGEKVEVMDHERKREEVLLSKDRGEKFAGEKEAPLK